MAVAMNAAIPLTVTQTETVGTGTRFKIRAPDGRVVAEGTLEAGLPAEPFAEHLILAVAASMAAQPSMVAPAAPLHAQFPLESGLPS